VNSPLNIVIIEPSSIICKGLSVIFNESAVSIQVVHAGNLQDAERYFLDQKQCVVILNPLFIQNNLKAFNNIKNEYPSVKWIAFIYAYFDTQIIAQFDGVINISDAADAIVANIKKIFADTPAETGGETLSDRETEVLQHMATGLSNKEIADRLNISINTVITHRKNISQKTGIKSIPGLTIYAVTKKLINLDNIL
jgi:DNA-binding NarL/FixJ family response regulator